MSQSSLKPEAPPVLVIEDEPAVLGFVRSTLETYGYGVVGVGSSVEALQLLENGSFLGIVSDMVTPGRSRRREDACLDFAPTVRTLPPGWFL